MKEAVRAWLQEEKVDIFIAYRMMQGHPLPHGFVKDRLHEVDDLINGDARYPLEKLAADIAARQPGIKIGILARDCTKRALNVLSIWNQLDPAQVETLDISCCPSDLRDRADCSYLKPAKTGCIKKQVGIDPNLGLEQFEDYSQSERFTRWINEFQRCIKCYGCRNVCPVCFCKACALEHPDLIKSGDLPPEVPIFHLVRAVHMAGRCIDCGLCEEACPVDMPLRLLYRKVNQIVFDLFDYRPGSSPQQSPFSVLGEKMEAAPRPPKSAGG